MESSTTKSDSGFLKPVVAIVELALRRCTNLVLLLIMSANAHFTGNELESSKSVIILMWIGVKEEFVLFDA
jgi:hypothetical protein